MHARVALRNKPNVHLKMFCYRKQCILIFFQFNTEFIQKNVKSNVTLKSEK